MATIFILLPISAMFITINYYGLLGSLKNDRAEPGKILSEMRMDKFITIMAFIYIIGGLVNFFAQYFFNTFRPPLSVILLVTAYFLVTGIVLIMLKICALKEGVKEPIFVMVMLLSIIMITIAFENSASITVWAAPFIIVLLSVIFSRRFLILWTGSLILIAQLYIWIKSPFAAVQVDGSDYIARLVIFGITFWLAYYVNRVYVKRLEGNEKQEIYEWCNEGIGSVLQDIPARNDKTFQWCLDKFTEVDFINIGDLETLPKEASAERQMLIAHRSNAMASITVKNKDKVTGLLYFTSVKKRTVFGEDHLEILTILSNILSDALVKVTSELEVRYLAYYDALTGLPNQTLFKDRLKQEIRNAYRTGKLFSVLFMDLDAFKAVNDTLGHQGGDEMLQQVAGRLTEKLRACDTVSRFGGDEFLILLTEFNQLEDIKSVAAKLINAITQPYIIKGQEYFITASIGIAVYPEDGGDD